MGLFQPGPETTIVLQRINRNNCFIVIIKWILVEWYLTLNFGNAHAIETN